MPAKKTSGTPKKVTLAPAQRMSKPSARTNVLPKGVSPSRGSNIKVKQSTIDEMKKIGMSEAIKKANSGNASAEFVEGAKRMYGNRVHPEKMMKDARPLTDEAKKKMPMAQSKTVTKSVSHTKKGKGTGKGRATGVR